MTKDADEIDDHATPQHELVEFIGTQGDLNQRSDPKILDSFIRAHRKHITPAIILNALGNAAMADTMLKKETDAARREQLKFKRKNELRIARRLIDYKPKEVKLTYHHFELAMKHQPVQLDKWALTFLMLLDKGEDKVMFGAPKEGVRAPINRAWLYDFLTRMREEKILTREGVVRTQTRRHHLTERLFTRFFGAAEVLRAG